MYPSSSSLFSLTIALPQSHTQEDAGVWVWESLFCVLLWASVLALTPFPLSTLDSGETTLDPGNTLDSGEIFNSGKTLDSGNTVRAVVHDAASCSAPPGESGGGDGGTHHSENDIRSMDAPTHHDDILR